MSSFKAAVWTLFFFLLQNALESIFPAIPFPFLVSAVIYFAITKGPVLGALIGLWAGLLLEALASGRFGTQMALWTAVGFFPGYLSSKVFPESVPIRMVLPMIVQAGLTFSEFLFRASGGSWPDDPLPRHNFWVPILMTLVTTSVVFRLFRGALRRS